MITVSMAVESKTLSSEVHACLQGEAVQMGFEPSDSGDIDSFAEKLRNAAPDLVLIDVSAPRHPRPLVLEKLRAAAPGSMIIALNTTADTGAVLECFRAGADEYLFSPLADGLKKAIERRHADRRALESTKAGGKVVTFLSSKGGCGATTLACHVAMAMAQLNLTVLLADLDIDSGMVAFLMKSRSPYSIADALSNMHRLDSSYWKALVSDGIPGLEIISAPTALAARHDLNLSETRQILDFTRSRYQWTVADAGRGINKSTISMLEAADQLCLVTTPEISALHQTKQILQTLLDAGYKQERLRLVLNRLPRRSGTRPEEMAEMFGIPLYAVFPESYSELHEALSQGKLLPSTSALGKSMGRLARKLAGISELPAKRRIPFFR